MGSFKFKTDKGIKYISSRTISFKNLLKEIDSHKPISCDEEIELIKKVKKGDEKSLKNLLKLHIFFIISVAKKYQANKCLLNLDDLINEGCIGLIKAAFRYDDTRGAKFLSYAVWGIQASMLDASIKFDKFFRLPQNIASTRSKAEKISNIFFVENGYYPENEYISKELEMCEHELNLILGVPKRIVSTNEPYKVFLNLDTFESVEFEATDLFGTDEFSPFEILHKESLGIEIERALNTIAEREKDVIKFYFGIGSPRLSFEEIAEKFNLTRERVSQIKEKAIRRLKQSSRSKFLKEYLGQDEIGNKVLD
ncbi:MAG: sigma-70 family RNA polymerase sigma factor [Minisyncoccia bacterium]